MRRDRCEAVVGLAEMCDAEVVTLLVTGCVWYAMRLTEKIQFRACFSILNKVRNYQTSVTLIPPSPPKIPQFLLFPISFFIIL